MSGIEFVPEGPPPRRGRGGSAESDAIAAALRERPGQWAIVKRSDNKGVQKWAYHIQHGNMKAFLPPGAFEATNRTVDGEFLVYARYVGEGNAR